MEVDPRTKQKRAVLSFPTSAISEVTGKNVKDEEGNMYFAGRRDDRKAAQAGESGASRPFMIIFNPEREVK
jgi:hypothetical protein